MSPKSLLPFVSKKRRSRNENRNIAFQALESRLLLTVSVELDGDVARIVGDQGLNAKDTIELESFDDSGTQTIRVFDPNGVTAGTGFAQETARTATVPLASVNRIQFQGGLDDDVLTVNLGDWGSVPTTIQFDGQSGDSDELIVLATSGDDRVKVDNLAILFQANDGSNLQVVDYDNVESISIGGQQGADEFDLDLPILAPLTIDGGGGQDQLAVAGVENEENDFQINSSSLDIATQSTSTIVEFSSLEKSATSMGLTIKGSDVNDTFTVNAPVNIGVTVHGEIGDTDQLIVNGTNNDDTIIVTNTTVDVGGTAIAYDGLEAPLVVDGQNGSDRFTVNAPVDLSVSIDGNSGTEDRLIVNGTASNDTVAITNTTVDVDGMVIEYSGLEKELEINGLDGDDQFTVNAPVDIGVSVDGDAGIEDELVVNGTAAGDAIFITDTSIDVGNTSIVFTELNKEVAVNGLAGNDLFTITAPVNIGVSIDGNAGTEDQLVVRGTAAGDTISITNSTVDVDGTAIAYSELERQLVVDGQDGNDLFTVDAPVDLGVSVDGNSGTADELVVNGTNADDMISITNSMIEFGSTSITYTQFNNDLKINGLSGNDEFTVHAPVDIGVSVDGNAGTEDELVVKGTVAGDMISITNSTVDVGSTAIAYVQLNNQLGIDGLGGNDLFTVDAPVDLGVLVDGGSGAEDEMTVNGTVADDSVVITNDTVKVGSTLITHTEIKKELHVNGGDGNDQFTINAPMDVRVSVDGDSGTEDELIVIGTTANDMISITNSTIDIDGTEIAYTGFDKRLDINGQDGNDVFTINAPLNLGALVNGDVGTEDELIVNGTEAGDLISITDTTVEVGSTEIVYAELENAIQSNGRGGNDLFTVDAPVPLGVVVNGEAGVEDQLVVNGTIADDMISVSNTMVVVGTTTIAYSLLEKELDINGDVGDDVITVQAPVNVGVSVDGNAGVADALVVNGTDAADMISIANTRIDVGSTSIAFADIEQALDVNGGEDSDVFTIQAPVNLGVSVDGEAGTEDELVVNGTNAGDLITITNSTIAVGSTVIAYDRVRKELDVNGLGGNDLFTVSSPVIAGVSVDGDSGTEDALVVNGTDSDDAFSIDNTTVVVGSTTISYTDLKREINVNGQNGDDRFTINAPVDLGALVDGGLGTADALTVNGTGTGDMISISNSAVNVGTTAIGYSGLNQELNINGQNGSDIFTIHAPVDLGVSVEGDSGTEDTLIVEGTAADNIISVDNTTISVDGTLVNYAGIKKELEISGLGGNDLFTINAPVSVGVLADGDSGTEDELVVNGTGANDAFTVTNAHVTVDSTVITYTNFEKEIDVNGQDDDDRFIIDAPVDLGVSVDGESGAADSLVINGTVAGDIVSMTNDTVRVGSTEIVYSGINNELDVNGLGGNDLFTVHAPVDVGVSVDGDLGAEDTLVVNGTTTNDVISITNTTVEVGSTSIAYREIKKELDINGRDGNDEFSIRAPVVVGVSLDGNTGTEDALIVDGTDADDMISISDTVITVGSTAIAYTDFEQQLDVNGQGGNDVFTVNAPVNLGVLVDGNTGTEDELVVHGTQIGDAIGISDTTVTVGTTAIVYAEIKKQLDIKGQGGSDVFTVQAPVNIGVSVDGNMGTADELVVNGTTADDTFMVTNTSVEVGSTLITYTQIRKELDIHGLAGNDIFNVVAPVDTGVQVNGGSETEDKLNVDGTAAGDQISISNTSVDVGSTIIAYNGVEQELMVNGRDGSDEFTVHAPLDLGVVLDGNSGAEDRLAVNGTDAGEMIAITNTTIDVGSTAIVYAQLKQPLDVKGLGGNDVFTVNAPVSIGVSVDGGLGTEDELVINGTSADDLISIMNSSIGVGTTSIDYTEIKKELIIHGLAGNDIFTVNAPVDLGVKVDGNTGNENELIVNGTANGDQISIDEKTVDVGTTAIEYMNVNQRLQVNGQNGSDVFTVQVPVEIDVSVDGNLGNEDELVVNGTEAEDSISITGTDVRVGNTEIAYSNLDKKLDVNGQGGNDQFTVQAPVDVGVSVDGNLGNGDELIVNGTVASDSMTIANSMVVVGSTVIDYLGLEETLDINGLSGNDQVTIDTPVELGVSAEGGLGAEDELIINGTDADDVIAIADSVVNVGSTRITFATFERKLDVNGQDGNDMITINSPVAIGVSADGNLGEDALVVNGTDADNQITVTDTDIDVGGTSISYLGLEETLDINGLGGNDRFTVTAPVNLGVSVEGDTGTDELIVNGTSGDDEMSITNRMVSVGDHTTISYDELEMRLRVNGQNGSDRITIQTPIDLDATVAGNAGAEDELIVNGTAADNTMTVTNTMVDVDDTNILYSGFEQKLDIDGQDGNDSFTVNAPVDVGVSVNGNMGTDRLVVNGTTDDDTILIANSTIDVGDTNIVYAGLDQKLDVNGGEGNDRFTVDAPVDLGVDIDGEAGTEDELIVNGTDDDDAIAVTNNKVEIGPTNIDYSGFEKKLLVNGRIGNDQFTVHAPIDLGVSVNGDEGDEDELIVNGTDDDDMISITNAMVSVGSTNIDYSTLEKAVGVNGRDGDDQFIVHAPVDLGVSVNGNMGAEDELIVNGTPDGDTITITNSSVEVDSTAIMYAGIDKELDVNGQQGNDVLTVNVPVDLGASVDGNEGEDQLTINGTDNKDVVTITASQVDVDDTKITYASIDSKLDVVTKDGDDEVTISSLSEAAMTNVLANEGDDQIVLNLSKDSSLSTTPGTELSLDGGGAGPANERDVVQINATADSASTVRMLNVTYADTDVGKVEVNMTNVDKDDKITVDHVEMIEYSGGTNVTNDAVTVKGTSGMGEHFTVRPLNASDVQVDRNGQNRFGRPLDTGFSENRSLRDVPDLSFKGLAMNGFEVHANASAVRDKDTLTVETPDNDTDQEIILVDGGVFPSRLLAVRFAGFDDSLNIVTHAGEDRINVALLKDRRYADAVRFYTNEGNDTVFLGDSGVGDRIEFVDAGASEAAEPESRQQFHVQGVDVGLVFADDAEGPNNESVDDEVYNQTMTSSDDRGPIHTVISLGAGKDIAAGANSRKSHDVIYGGDGPDMLTAGQFGRQFLFPNRALVEGDQEVDESPVAIDTIDGQFNRLAYVEAGERDVVQNWSGVIVGTGFGLDVVGWLQAQWLEELSDEELSDIRRREFIEDHATQPFTENDGLNPSNGDIWFEIEPTNNRLDIAATAEPKGTVNELALFSRHGVPVSTASSTTGQIQFSAEDITENESYLLRLRGDGTSVSLRLGTHSSSSPQMPMDSNRDGHVTAVDALLIINELNQPSGQYRPEIDINRDGLVSPIDALLVINALNQAVQSAAIPAGEMSTGSSVPEIESLQDISAAIIADELIDAMDELKDKQRLGRETR